VLWLQDNQLTGLIPESICELTNLDWSPDFIDFDYSYIYNNQLCPPYPSCIEDYVGEQDISNCDVVELWGEYFSIENTTELDLSNNQLTGEIPSEIGDLINLTTLNLSDNQFTGGIPKEIGDLTNLTELDLSNNQLTGYIPSQLGNLTNLTNLYLNDNQLTGQIPESICDLNIDWSNNNLFNITINQLCPPYPSCIEDYVGTQGTSDCD
jgi:Leucine-rich repeat (LRR) protein